MTRKKSFIEAYTYMFGCTKNDAEKEYKRADDLYIDGIIEGFKMDCRKAFYCD